MLKFFTTNVRFKPTFVISLTDLTSLATLQISYLAFVVVYGTSATVLQISSQISVLIVGIPFQFSISS